MSAFRAQVLTDGLPKSRIRELAGELAEAHKEARARHLSRELRTTLAESAFFFSEIADLYEGNREKLALEVQIAEQALRDYRCAL